MATKLLYVEDFCKKLALLEEMTFLTNDGNWKDECTHNHEHTVDSISHKADEIYTGHF